MQDNTVSWWVTSGIRLLMTALKGGEDRNELQLEGTDKANSGSSALGNEKKLEEQRGRTFQQRLNTPKAFK